MPINSPGRFEGRKRGKRGRGGGGRGARGGEREGPRCVDRLQILLSSLPPLALDPAILQLSSARDPARG
eukprot:841793-Rhodomonas_salina.1